ncbi:MAG: NAD-dependent epimerase/dehydratase family protein [Planctomycetota bacterium]
MTSNGAQVDWKTARVVVTGGSGFLGRHVIEGLHARGVTDDRIFVPRSKDFDLTEHEACARLYADAFGGEKVDVMIHLAAEVGGIGANRENPGRYFFANMAMALHLIEEARKDGFADRGAQFVQTGTICAYPNLTPVPFKEENLWEGYPEVTNAPYGVAKKAAWQMLDAYKLQYGMKSSYVLPVNLYGPWDNFNLHSSHVIPALIRKCVEAQDAGQDYLEVWGTGSASREFLFVEDAADGILTAAEKMGEPTPVNLGTNFEITIRDLVHLIAKKTGFATEGTIESKIRWDSTKPDGQPRRCLDVTRAKELMSWEAKVGFEEGLERTIAWFREHRDNPEARM